MAEVKNIERLQKKLQEMAARYADGDKVDVAVGYTAAYALRLHENRQMKWRGLPRDRTIRFGFDEFGKKIAYYGFAKLNKMPGLFWGPAGRAGFLLDVAREMSAKLAATVRDMLTRGKTVGQALLVAGLQLQRESQKNVPVLTGNLRASAFTRLERK